MYFALGQPAGQWLAFSVLFGFGCMMMYVYYATVYSTIQDVIEPSLRATAMALYFAAMYAFGGALGPTVIGQTSDYFANQAAATDGVDLTTLDAAGKLPYRAYGLNSALYALPVTSLLLAGTLFAGARTVNSDVDKLQRWMRETSASEKEKPQLVKAVT
jgi:MFS family permease